MLKHIMVLGSQLLFTGLVVVVLDHKALLLETGVWVEVHQDCMFMILGGEVKEPED
jgi:hypothetical protein